MNEDLITMQEKLALKVAGIQSDMEKFTKGISNVAGTRVRKRLQEIKHMSHEMRKIVLEKQKKEKKDKAS